MQVQDFQLRYTTTGHPADHGARIPAWWVKWVGSAVLLALAAACGTDDMTHEGGGWYTTFTSGHTLGKTTLYRRDRAMPVRVDDNVFIRGFHPPDCLLYEPQRRSGVVYAVCGARIPVPVAAYVPSSQDRSYVADSSGLYMSTPFGSSMAGW